MKCSTRSLFCARSFWTWNAASSAIPLLRVHACALPPPHILASLSSILSPITTQYLYRQSCILIFSPSLSIDPTQPIDSPSYLIYFLSLTHSHSLTQSYLQRWMDILPYPTILIVFCYSLLSKRESLDDSTSHSISTHK